MSDHFEQNYRQYALDYHQLYTREADPLGLEVAEAYSKGRVQGWDEDLARDAFNVVGSSGVFVPLGLDGRVYAGRKMMLWDACRKVLGRDTPNYPQEIGDCVSFGAKNGTEYLTCLDILLRNKSFKWRPVFPPYYYHTSRIKVGGGRIPPDSDGSLGSWMAEAVVKWGTIFSDEPGVPKYSGSLAKRWGGIRDVGTEHYEFGKKHLVKSAALIRSWDDLVAAVVNGYPCPTASNVGYEMVPSADGFHRRGPAWSHQMCFIGVGFAPEEYAVILNNWGDVHGRLKDFDTGEDLPVGVLRVRRREAEAHIQANDTYAWSQFEGFPEQVDKIARELFKVVGN